MTDASIIALGFEVNPGISLIPSLITNIILPIVPVLITTIQVTSVQNRRQAYEAPIEIVTTQSTVKYCSVGYR